MRAFAFILLFAVCASAGALEIVAPAPGCSSSDVSTGKSLWKQIDKAADGSEVKLTNTENRRLWCYNDSLHAKDGITPQTALLVHITIIPDPDSDHDGVPDAADSCPKTPPAADSCAECQDSTTPGPVDYKGCTLP